MAGKELNIKVCSPLKQCSGLTGNYHPICYYSYNLPLASIAWGRLPGTKIGVRYFIVTEGIERLLDAALEPKAAEKKSDPWYI